MALPSINPLPPAPQRQDDPEVFTDRADAMMAALPPFVLQLNDFATQLMVSVNGIDYNGTSTSSVLIGTGAKSFQTQAGKNFQIGQSLRFASTSAPANYIDGYVTSYSGTTLNVTGTAVGGSGTPSAWTISLLPGAGSFATLAGAEALLNKTLTTPVLSATASGTAAGSLGYASGDLSYGDGTSQRVVVSTDKTQTLTNKTIDFAVGGNVGKINGNTFAATAGTGTITFFNSSDTVVGRSTTDDLANKRLITPVLYPTVSGATAGALGYSGGAFTYGDGSNQRTVANLNGSQSFSNKSFDSAPFATVTGTAPIYGARAWVNFNGTGTVAINGSGNVSSVTDNGVGDYTVNFTTALPDANYAPSYSIGNASNSVGITTHATTTSSPPTQKTTSALRVATGTWNNVATDCYEIGVSILR